MDQSTHRPPSAADCRKWRKHQRESWFLLEACKLGNFETLPGVNLEVDEDCTVWAWKVMECGCIAVVGPLLQVAS